MKTKDKYWTWIYCQVGMDLYLDITGCKWSSCRQESATATQEQMELLTDRAATLKHIKAHITLEENASEFMKACPVPYGLCSHVEAELKP